MTIYAGRNTRLFIGGYDISAIASKVTPQRKREFASYGVMDGVAAYHRFPIIADDTIVIEGIFDDAQLAILNTMRAGTATQHVMMPLGTAKNDQALCASGVWQPEFTEAAVATDINKVTVNLQVDGTALDECKMIQPQITSTAGGTSAVSTNETAQSTLGGVGYLQVTNVSPTSSFLTEIQHSSDNGSSDAWAAVATFNLVGVGTAHSAQRVIATGTVKQYIQVAWSQGGSGKSATWAIAWKRY